MSQIIVFLVVLVLGGFALSRRIKKERRRRREAARRERLSKSVEAARLRADHDQVITAIGALGAFDDRAVYFLVCERIAEREGRWPHTARLQAIDLMCRAECERIAEAS